MTRSLDPAQVGRAEDRTSDRKKSRKKVSLCCSKVIMSGANSNVIMSGGEMDITLTMRQQPI